MRKNIYLPNQFESIVAENGLNMSELSQRAILEADPHAKWLVVMRSEGSKIPELASTVILADCRQMEALNDYLRDHKFVESYSWYPSDTLEEAEKIWQQEVQKMSVRYGIIGDIRHFDACPVAFVNAQKIAKHG